MELSELVARQIQMDELHGFRVRFEIKEERQIQILKDVVGLVGEVGEFANTVKKIGLALDHPGKYIIDVESAEANLREELVDSLIYLIRLSSILKVDLEEELLKKMKINLTRYENIRQP